MGNEPKVVWELAAELGEGPVWVQRDEALWFVDIKQRQIHRYEPASGGKRSFEAPEEVGFILPAERGGFVVGLKSGLYHFDEMSDAFDLIVEVEPDKPNNRLNDGVVDPAGRLWFGTMDNEERAKSGAFYCFADNRLTPTGIDGIAITNGPAVSPDGRILYFVDTLKGTIEAADIRDDGSLAGRRPFAQVDPKNGHPDGPTIDSNGYVWVSLYGGWEDSSLFASRRSRRAHSLPGSQYHQDRFWRSRSAHRLRHHRAPVADDRRDCRAATDWRPVRVASRRARSAMSPRSLLILRPIRIYRGSSADHRSPVWKLENLVRAGFQYTLGVLAALGFEGSFFPPTAMPWAKVWSMSPTALSDRVAICAASAGVRVTRSKSQAAPVRHGTGVRVSRRLSFQGSVPTLSPVCERHHVRLFRASGKAGLVCDQSSKRKGLHPSICSSSFPRVSCTSFCTRKKLITAHTP